MRGFGRSRSKSARSAGRRACPADEGVWTLGTRFRSSPLECQSAGIFQATGPRRRLAKRSTGLRLRRAEAGSLVMWWFGYVTPRRLIPIRRMRGVALA